MCYRWACRICEVASASLHPCDFKYSKLLSSLQTFRCTYNFEIRYYIWHFLYLYYDTDRQYRFIWFESLSNYYTYWHRLTSVQAEPFKKVILKAISHLTEEVQNARALVDGHLVSYNSYPLTIADLQLEKYTDANTTKLEMLIT